MAIVWDLNGVRNIVLPELNSSKTDLISAKNTLATLNVPVNFSQRNQLINFSNTIRTTETNVNNIVIWLEDTVRSIQNAENQANFNFSFGGANFAINNKSFGLSTINSKTAQTYAQLFAAINSSPAVLTGAKFATALSILTNLLGKAANGINSVGVFSGFTSLLSQIPFDKLKVNRETAVIIPSGEVPNANIFDAANNTNRQYGSDQGTMTRILTEQRTIDIIAKYFPGVTVSIDDRRSLLAKISSVGCNVASPINTVFQAFEGREEEFLTIFGFPMHTVGNSGSVNFNYEYIMLEFYLYFWVGQNGCTLEQLLLSHLREGASTGFRNSDLLLHFTPFMKETYNIDVEVKSSAAMAVNLSDSTRLIEYSPSVTFDNFPQNLVNEGYSTRSIPRAISNGEAYSISEFVQKDLTTFTTWLRAELANGNYITLSGANYTLTATANNTRVSEGTEMLIPAHAISVVGMVDNNTLLISTWGTEWTLNLRNDVDNIFGAMSYNYSPIVVQPEEVRQPEVERVTQLNIESQQLAEQQRQQEIARQQEAERLRQEELARQEAERLRLEELARQEAERLKQQQVATPTNKKTNEEIAREVIAGNWGNNPERKQRLEAAGYDAAEIQRIVNQLLK